jgi:predicted TIM-barrel fold metal-dependent hydrolase
MTSTPRTLTYAPARRDWLALLPDEEVLEPELLIVDAHHHLWDRPETGRYLVDEFLEDVRSGHDVAATVYVDCRSFYRAAGPGHLKPVGEVEFAQGVAAIGASRRYGTVALCERIVGHADLCHPAVEDALLAMAMAGGPRFRGIRQVSAWDASDDVLAPEARKRQGLLLEPEFRRGFSVLDRLSLSFDAFMYHHQLPDVADLARAFPDATIIVDHCGGPVGIGPYKSRSGEVFAEWSRNIAALGKLPNVRMKIGGLGMRMFGFGLEDRPRPASSTEIAALWQPFVDTCLEAFGPARTMFESNFPPDKGSCSYRTLWNALKRTCSGMSAAEKHRLFAGTAAATYGIDLDHVARRIANGVRS